MLRSTQTLRTLAQTTSRSTGSIRSPTLLPSTSSLRLLSTSRPSLAVGDSYVSSSLQTSNATDPLVFRSDYQTLFSPPLILLSKSPP